MRLWLGDRDSDEKLRPILAKFLHRFLSTKSRSSSLVGKSLSIQVQN